MNTETTQKNPALAPEEITQKDVTKAYLRWHFANEIPHSFDRLSCTIITIWNDACS